MIEQFFLKFVKDGKIVRHTIVNESIDVLGLRSIRLGGVVFDETNIVTVSGVNSLEDRLAIVSGAVDIRDAALDAKIDSVSSTSEFNDNALLALINGVSGLSDANDTVLQLQITSNDADILALQGNITGVSSSSDDNDAILQGQITSNDAEIATLQTDVLGVSSSSDDNDAILQAQITANDGDISTLFGQVLGVSSSSDDNDAILQAQITSNDAEIATLQTDVLGVSSSSDDNDAILQLQITSNDIDITGVSSSSDDNDAILQAQIDAITSDIAQEECIESVSGERTFAVSGFVFNSSNSIKDLMVFRNTGHMKQQIDYDKNSDTEIEFNYDTNPGDVITIREERTGGTGSGGGGGGSSQTLLSIIENANYTVLTTDNIRTVVMNNVTGQKILTLPSAAANDDRIITIAREGTTSKNNSSFVQIVPSGGDTVINYGELRLYAKGSSVTLQSDGTNWHYIADNGVVGVWTLSPTFDPSVQNFSHINEINVDCNGANRIVTLEPADNHQGRVFWVKKTDDGLFTLTLEGDGAETIDGALNFVLYQKGHSVGVKSDGSEWHIVGSHLDYYPRVRTTDSDLFPWDAIASNHVIPVQYNFPSSPNPGDKIKVNDASVSGASVNNITLTGNGNDVNGVSAFTINTDGDAKTFMFFDSGVDWRAI